ncbi:Uncharacterised protein [uncultured archaeon]|nr:Uncharacterised protein [uncultured archaeon]
MLPPWLSIYSMFRDIVDVSEELRIIIEFRADDEPVNKSETIEKKITTLKSCKFTIFPITNDILSSSPLDDDTFSTYPILFNIVAAILA